MMTATCCTTGTEAAELLELEVGVGDVEVDVREVPQPNNRVKTIARATKEAGREKRIVTMSLAMQSCGPVLPLDRF
jgi:hypothetical protein